MANLQYTVGATATRNRSWRKCGVTSSAPSIVTSLRGPHGMTLNAHLAATIPVNSS